MNQNAALPPDLFNDFINHKSSSFGGSYLTGWKKREPPEINVWLSLMAKPLPIWRHAMPKLIVRESRETREIEKFVYNVRYLCFEEEALLKKQYARNKDGSREAPPLACPLCRLIED